MWRQTTLTSEGPAGGPLAAGSSSLRAPMAEIEPLTALRYNLEKTGGLQDVVAPPYDVIDAEQRAALADRSPYNVVRIDLPQGDNPYQSAAEQFAQWQQSGAVVRDEQPALWALAQEFTGPDGRRRTRRGFL